MTTKQVHHPVVDTVCNIQLSQFLQQSNMPDSVKGFAEIQSNDHNVWVGGEKL